MILTDVNVLVAAFRNDHQEHVRCRDFLQSMVNSLSPFGTSELVFSGFLRIVTHPGIFKGSATLEDALKFAAALRTHPSAVPVRPGRYHWEIFSDLCSKTEARGNLVPDAYFAAMAIESRCKWITLDRDFARFPGLEWSAPQPLGFPLLTVHQRTARNRRDR